MSNGLKSGSQDDPFAEDEGDEDDEDAAETTAAEEQADEQVRDTSADATATSDETTTAAEQTSAEPASDHEATESYLDRRSGAKDERKLVQFFLRSEVFGDRDETQLRMDVADELGMDDLPGKFDVREAMVQVAQEHPEEVAAALREMGY